MAPSSPYSYHLSALKFHADRTGTLERLKDNPVSDTDRTVIDTDVKITAPIEMQNNEKERHRYGQVVSILMAWTYEPAADILEHDRLTIDGIDYKIRKVKKWPQHPTPAFYELHLEDES